MMLTRRLIVAGDDVVRRISMQRDCLGAFQARLAARGEVVRCNPVYRAYLYLMGTHASKAARFGQSGDDRDDRDQDKDRQRDVPVAEDDILNELLYRIDKTLHGSNPHY